MDGVCETVAQLTLDQMFAKLQSMTGPAPGAHNTTTSPTANPAPQFPVNAARSCVKPEGVIHIDANGVSTKSKAGTSLTTYEIRDDLLCVYFRSRS